MKTPIKPCPFCGGKAEFRCTGFIIECEAGWIQCGKCGACSSPFASDIGAKSEPEVRRAAMRRWNRRTQ